MFELALLGVVGVVCYRRFVMTGRWDLAEIRSGLRQRLADHRRRREGRPSLLAQCATDLRSLGDDLGAPYRRKRRARQLARSGLADGSPDAILSPGDVPSAGATRAGKAAGQPMDPAFARLHRLYLAGGITLEEYVEGARELRERNPRGSGPVGTRGGENPPPS